MCACVCNRLGDQKQQQKNFQLFLYSHNMEDSPWQWSSGFKVHKNFLGSLFKKTSIILSEIYTELETFNSACSKNGLEIY